ncbi:hypothetical protein [Paraburkholderia aspalathi]|uniref:hypothetical protein n=1 Tax=Paraburkholderia aspalathi TaxID=1324617 RepID=UPI0038B78045
MRVTSRSFPVARAVSLNSIEDLQGVNRLLSGQVLSFGVAPGLEVVYGNNGVGKSGYARVIKRACRTRGAPPAIQPDVFAQPLAAGVHASCRIVLNVAGQDTPLNWQDGATPDPLLSHIFVFDSAAATHYLQSDGPATFTPYGLDVLPRLSAVCDTIGGSVKSSIDALNLQIKPAKADFSAKFQKTQVGIILEKLSSTTDKEVVAKAAIVLPAEEERLAELKVILSTNAKQKSQATRASKGRLDSFRTLLVSRDRLLAPEALHSLETSLKNASAATEVARAFLANWTDPSSLAGTGNRE